MKITPEELKAKLDAHKLWLETRGTGEVKGERLNLTGADLSDADLTDADLTRADLTISNASPLVCDALAAVFSARMALLKTRKEWIAAE